MKIALIGYGKMGRMIEQIAKERGHEIVCVIDIDNQEDFASEAFSSADVAIEFTAPKVAVSNYIKAFNSGVSVVSGTTGWTEKMPEVDVIGIPKVMSSMKWVADRNRKNLKDIEDVVIDFYKDNTYTIVYNGQLYNVEDIRNKLIKLDYEFTRIF